MASLLDISGQGESVVTALLDNHLVRKSVLHGALALCEKRGVTLTDSDLPGNFTVNAFHNNIETEVIRLIDFEALLVSLSNATGDAHFGLSLALTQRPTELLGALGFAMQQQPTVLTALQRLRRSFSFQATGVGIDLQVQGREAQLIPDIYRRYCLPPIKHSIEYCLAASIPVIQALLNRPWQPTLLKFTHRKPQAAGMVGQLPCPIEYNSDYDAVCFPLCDLSAPIDDSAQRLRDVRTNYADELDRRYPQDFKARVDAAIHHAMRMGRATADDVAAMLATNRRTLHRRLRQKHTTFTESLSTIRQQQANYLLRDTAMPITTIGLLLGYSETSAFSRAFSRATGMSPRTWRRQQRACKIAEQDTD